MWLAQEEVDAQIEVRSKRRQELLNEAANIDIVGSFAHNKVVDITKASDHVAEVGEEVNCLDEGFDFAVAVVDKITGAITIKPALLYEFQAKYAKNKEDLINKRKRTVDDFDKDYTIANDQWAQKRRELTSVFGSSKKIKFQEQSLKRQIKTDTLDELRKTAFASNSNVGIDSIKAEQISLVQKAVSSILPLPVYTANLAKDIYPLSMFVNSEEVELMQEAAIEFFERKKKEYVADGFPELLLAILHDEKEPTRSVAYLLLGTMINILITLGKSKSILKKELNDLKMPSAMKIKVQAEYFPDATSNRGVTNRGADRIKLNLAQYDRFLAHALALALTLAPAHLVPTTPFHMALGYPLTKLEKLFEGLGCNVMKLNNDDAVRMKSLRAAQLFKAPSGEAPTPRRKTRR